MPGPAPVVVVTDRHKEVLEAMVRASSTPQRLAERARIVLMSARGLQNFEQAAKLGVDRQRVRRWRQRWATAQQRLAIAEQQEPSPKDLQALIVDVLCDTHRCGGPPTFTPEQVAKLIALACEPPGDSGLPVSHWTPTELAWEATKRGFIEQISPQQVDRCLGEARLRPHKSQYWLTSKDKREDPQQYQADVEKICSTYQRAPQLAAQGAHVISTDEKTRMQATQRLHETKPVRPGLVERVEFEYIRHGTLSLIANFDVATGRVISPAIGPTRTESDFVVNIEKTIDTDPHGVFVFIVDQLNTHKSASLVEMVARRCGIDDDLGIKGKTGVLKSQKTRRAFLEDQSHRIRFVYMPRHCSWLNQVEIWFSILARRLLKRSSFASCDELRARVLAFIDYFNAVLAKPFKWTYTGRPLQA